MAKDPAFLFYSNDFLSGTFTMTDEQVGKYIRLLCIQHQKGILTKKDMLNICKTYDEDIFCKFSQDDNGNYFNIRLKEEFEKRRAYSESRSKNRKSIKKKKVSKSYVQHMENENENVIINEYRKFKHLIITKEENQKLLNLKYTQKEIDSIYDSIENYKQNTKYVSLYLTALKWLKKEYGEKGKPKLSM